MQQLLIYCRLACINKITIKSLFQTRQKILGTPFKPRSSQQPQLLIFMRYAGALILVPVLKQLKSETCCFSFFMSAQVVATTS